MSTTTHKAVLWSAPTAGTAGVSPAASNVSAWKAQDFCGQALEIDPHSLPINADYGQVLYFAKDYDRAIEQLRKTLAMDPNFLFAHTYLYQVYTKKGM